MTAPILSTTPVPSPFLAPRNRAKSAREDYARGGIAIQNPSQGLNVKDWHGFLAGNTVMLEAENVLPTAVLTVPVGIQEFQFTFDQNMNPFIAYYTLTQIGAFYWYDTTIPGFTTTQLPAGSLYPRCALDDNRSTQTTPSDIILAYMRNGSLYYRLQRERYLNENLLSNTLAGWALVNIGMSVKLRFQFRMRKQQTVS